MTNGKIAAMTIGVAGVIALGVLAGPSLVHRDPAPAAEPAAVMTPAPVEAEKPRAARAPKPRVDREARASESEKRTIAPDIVPTLPASEPELHARLKPVLNRGARMEVAAEGFRDAEQFATVAHAARNTQVPFMVLKHRVLEEGQTLAEAIRASRPDIDISREVTRAQDAARYDIAVIVRG